MPNNKFPKRFAIYLKERFPPHQLILLSLIFGTSAGIFAQKISMGSYQTLRIIFSSTALLLFLFRLRIFDEFKDYYHDKKYYPLRPIPRGLLSFRELRILILATILFEFIVSFTNGLISLTFYLFAFFYSLLLLKEFFVKNWLRNHFATYISVHELLALFLFYYLFSLNVKTFGQIFETKLFLFSVLLVILFFSLEVARKIRPKNLEISSKDTYSAQYGIKGAIKLLAFISIAGFLFSIFILLKIDSLIIWTILPILIGLFFLIISLNQFANSPTEKLSKKVFFSTAVYTIISLININLNLWVR
jgi:4-hydroxybenzoate polyprenyltransferase